MKHDDAASLRQKIKERVGLEGIEGILGRFVNPDSPVFRTSDKLEAYQKILEQTKNPEKRDLYAFFYEMGKDSAVKKFSLSRRAGVFDALIDAADEAVELPQRKELLAAIRKRDQELSCSLDDRVDYWQSVLGVLYEVHTQYKRSFNTKRALSSVLPLSCEEVRQWHEKIDLSDYTSLLCDLIDSGTVVPDTPQLLDRYGNLTKLFAGVPLGLEFLSRQAPKPELLRRIYENLNENEANFRQIFSFLTTTKLSAEERASFMALASRDIAEEAEERSSLNEYFVLLQALTEQQQLVAEVRAKKLPLKKALTVSGISLYPPEANLAVPEENTFFTFVNDLAAEVPGKRSDYVLDKHFVANTVLPLYLLDRTGLFSRSQLRQLREKLVQDEKNISAVNENQLFYQHCWEWIYFSSLGTVIPESIFHFYLNIGHDEKSSGQYLAALVLLKEQRPEKFHELADVAFEYVKKMPHDFDSFNAEDETLLATVLLEGLRDSKLESFLSADKTAGSQTQDWLRHLYQLKGTREERLTAAREFLSRAREFYSLLETACEPELIHHEYQEWLRQAPAAKSINDWLGYFSLDSPAVKEVFQRYYAPATFLEQREIARLVARLVARQDLPLESKTVPNLALEIPFGGGRAVSLPNEIHLFKAKRDNAKLYTLLASLYAGMHVYGSFDLTPEAMGEAAARRKAEQTPTSLQEYFTLFDHQELAESIFIAAEQVRLFSHLTKEYPGLESDLQAYLMKRQDIVEKTKFAHPAEEQVQAAFYKALQPAVKENAATAKQAAVKPVVTKTATTISPLAQQFQSLQGKKSVADSLLLAEEAYTWLERYWKRHKQPLPKKEKKLLDARIIEEIMQRRLRGQQDIVEYTVSKEGAHHYPEYHPEQAERLATVYEEVVPARENQFARLLITQQQTAIGRMREQLEKLAPPDVYLERRKFFGTLDRRALLRYHRDLEQGKVPDPRIKYKKRVEKRDVATIFALNMNRLINQPREGVPPRIPLQQLLVSFLEASRSLGDTLGLYGYSGTGRENVTVYIFKDIAEPLTDEAYYRLALVGGKSYGRSGAAYRHFTSKLASWRAEKRLFIELCPSYAPADVDYAGERALQDSALAMNGLRLQGIEPLCICLSADETSRQNLERVYGLGNYLLTTSTKLQQDLTSAYTALTKRSA